MDNDTEIKTVVTQRGDMPPVSVTADVTVIAMPWWQAIGVRVLRVYLQGLLGFLAAGASGISEAVTGVSVGSFAHLFVTAASLAVAPAVMSLLQNSVELLTKLDVTNPTLRA